MKQPRSVWPIVVAATLGILILCGLGAWQLQRLAQKQELLAEFDRRAGADAVGLSEAKKRQESGENVEFLKVSVTGRFLHDAEKYMIGVFDGNPAWEVVTPLVTADNTLILVDRGLVPDEKRNPATRPEDNPVGSVAITGILRLHPNGRGPFSPDNDIKANMWFWWDVPAMLDATPAPGAKSAPFVLHMIPVAGQKNFPRPAALRAAIPNNHLQYAITWFALALVLAAIAGLFIRGHIKKSGA